MRLAGWLVLSCYTGVYQLEVLLLDAQASRQQGRSVSGCVVAALAAAVEQMWVHGWIR